MGFSDKKSRKKAEKQRLAECVNQRKRQRAFYAKMSEGLGTRIDVPISFTIFIDEEGVVGDLHLAIPGCEPSVPVAQKLSKALAQLFGLDAIAFNASKVDENDFVAASQKPVQCH